MLERLIVSALKKIVAKLPFRTITGTDGKPYLTRWYLWPSGPRSADDVTPAATAPFALFIHYFHRSDEDRDQHNHPWDMSVALILAGGYHEERGDSSRLFKPGSINIIRKDDYHRVDLLDPKRGSWSLFVAGKNVGSWGFRDGETLEHIPWNEYLLPKAKETPKKPVATVTFKGDGLRIVQDHVMTELTKKRTPDGDDS